MTDAANTPRTAAGLSAATLKHHLRIFMDPDGGLHLDEPDDADWQAFTDAVNRAIEAEAADPTPAARCIWCSNALDGEGRCRTPGCEASTTPAEDVDVRVSVSHYEGPSPFEGSPLVNPDDHSPASCEVWHFPVRHGEWRAALAATHEPEGLDVERLREAGANVLDGRRIGSVRLYRNTITPNDWRNIAAEYNRLAAEAER